MNARLLRWGIHDPGLASLPMAASRAAAPPTPWPPCSPWLRVEPSLWKPRSICRPQCQRRHVLDEDAISRDDRLRPRRGRREAWIAGDRLEARAVVPQHEQFAVVL